MIDSLNPCRGLLTKKSSFWSTKETQKRVKFDGSYCKKPIVRDVYFLWKGFGESIEYYSKKQLGLDIGEK